MHGPSTRGFINRCFRRVLTVMDGITRLRSPEGVGSDVRIRFVSTLICRAALDPHFFASENHALRLTRLRLTSRNVQFLLEQVSFLDNEHFFEEVRSNGRSVVRCVTSPVNRDSVAFHEALGFEVDRVAKDYDGPGEDRVLLVKRL